MPPTPTELAVTHRPLTQVAGAVQGWLALQGVHSAPPVKAVRRQPGAGTVHGGRRRRGGAGVPGIYFGWPSPRPLYRSTRVHPPRARAPPPSRGMRRKAAAMASNKPLALLRFGSLLAPSARVADVEIPVLDCRLEAGLAGSELESSTAVRIDTGADLEIQERPLLTGMAPMPWHIFNS